MIGLAAVCIATAVVAEPPAFGIAPKGAGLPIGNRLELFIGAFVGAITFSGSVIAFGKLSGKYKLRVFRGAVGANLRENASRLRRHCLPCGN